jgi:RCC1 and BTB domain-containing protein
MWLRIADAGRVFTWGNGDHGKLGHGDTARSCVPRIVEAFDGKIVCRVVSYNEHTVAQVTASIAEALPASRGMLAADMRSLLQSGLHSDVVFVVPGRPPVPAHKAVLSARSEHFRYVCDLVVACWSCSIERYDCLCCSC